MSESIIQYRRSGNFWSGGVVTDQYSIIQDDDGNWYRYIGLRPKPFNVTPGVRPNAENWLSVGTLITSGPSNAIQGESFAAGGTIDNAKEFILDEDTGLWYFWTGAFPKVVPSGSTPEQTGGIGNGKWKLLNGTGSADTSNLLSKDDNLANLADPDAALANLKGMYKPDVDGLAKFADLRTRVPKYEGERVYIKCHTPPAISGLTQEGGGWFKARMKAQADDGGYVASSGGNWHWERDLKIDHLTIAEFGGVADGITDAQPAFKALLEFMISNYARLRTGGTLSGSTVTGGTSYRLPLRFNAGKYYVKPGQYNKYGPATWNADQAALNPSGFQAYGGIRIEGAKVESGEMLLTTIISDKTDSPVFLLNHRSMNVSYIEWNGQQTTDMDATTKLLVGTVEGVDAYNKYASNKQPFLKNECPGGCFVKINSFSTVNAGSYTFYVLDTLDTIVEKFRASGIAGPFLQTGWSDPNVLYYGAWDHSTSIELRNGNILSNACPALWLPRVQQGVMRNVWISGPSYCAYDINNGQWIMDMICVEGSYRNPIHWNSKIALNTYSAPTGNSIDTNAPNSGLWYSYKTNPDGSPITSWVNDYDLGDYRLETYGAYYNCPVVTLFDRGIIRGSNNTDSTLWVNVGQLKNPNNGGFWKIRVLGSRFYATSSSQNVINDDTPGETTIFIGRSTTLTPKNSWYSSGSGPVALAPQYGTQPFIDTIPSLWIPIKPRCAEFSIFVESTGITRREAGVPTQFKPSGATQTTNPGLNPIASRFSLHNGQAGFGALDSVAAIHSASSPAVNQSLTTVATDAQFANEPVHPNIIRWERLNINGQVMAVPIYAWKPAFTTSNPATATVATGGTLTLTTAVTDAVSQQWQFSSDNGTTWNNVAGATAVVLTKTSVAAGDAGQYRLAVRSNNGAGASGITSFGPVTTVTVT